VGARGGRAFGGDTFDSILDHLRATWSPGDVVICLGAGDITLLAGRIAEEPFGGAPAPAMAIAGGTC
jgi:hypothetical protein